MRKLLLICFIICSLTGAIFAQQQVITQSGGLVTFPNAAKAASITVGLVIAGSPNPSSSTVIISGITGNNNKDTLSTYAANTSTTITPAITKTYVSFIVQAYWQGGNNVGIAVTVTPSGGNNPGQGPIYLQFQGVPTGACTSNQTANDVTTGNYYDCGPSGWVFVGPGSGGIGYPSGSGIPIVSSGSAWGTTLADPLVVGHGGTGTASTLTGIVRGGSPLTASEISGDATTSGSNAVTVVKINGTSLAGLATGIIKNTTATGVPSIAAAADVYGLFTSCTGSSGLFLKDGGTCAAPGGSGTVNNASQYAEPYYSASGSTNIISGLAPPAVNGTWQSVWNVSGAAAVTKTVTLGGVNVDTSNPATLLYSDRTSYLPWTSGTALALPAVTTCDTSHNFGCGMAFALQNTEGATLTVTPNAGQSDLIDGSATATLLNKFATFVYQQPYTSGAGAWNTVKFPTFAAFGSTCASALNWSTSTGFGCQTALPLSNLATQGANTVVANVTSGTAAPTAASIPSGIQNYVAGTGYNQATAHQMATPLACNDASGSGTAQTCTTSPTFTPAAKDCINYNPGTTNTGALTLNVNASTAAPVQKWLGSAVASGDVVANKTVTACYDGTNWQLDTIGNAPGGAVSSVNTLTGAVVIEAATAGQMAVSGGPGAALTGAADMTYSTHTFSTLTTGIFDWSAATSVASLKFPAVAGGTVLAGTDTANLSAPIQLVNTNSSNNNTSVGAIVGAAGTSTGGIGEVVFDVSGTGDIERWYSGGSVSNGVYTVGTLEMNLTAAGVLNASFAGPVAATTLAASSTVSGAGFSTYLASPPAIGGTSAAAGAFTTLSASSTVSGTGFSTYLASPPAIGGTARAAGSFTALAVGVTGTTSGVITGSGSASGTATLTWPATAGTTTNAITSSNNLSAPALVSTVTTGTPPLTVTSTTNVANLNAATVGGINLGTPVAGGIGYGTSTTQIGTAAAGTTGQIVLSGGTGAPTMIDFPERYFIPAANCNNATAGAGWSIPSGGTVTCRAGTNNLSGYVTITDTSSTFAQFTLMLPVDWDSATRPYIKFYFSSASDTTNGHTVIPQVKVSCPTAANGTTSDDATFSAAQSSSTVTFGGSAVANGFYNGSSVQFGSTQMTGCIAGGMMIVQVGRATDTATGNINFYGADVTFPRLVSVQAN